jgi:hypothetical protein
MAADGDGAARPTASGSTFTKLSEFYPYGDDPPRLAAGLNDTPTDASPTAQFNKLAKPKPKVAGKKDPPERATEVDVPLRDLVPEAALHDGKTITDVCEWVTRRLAGGLGFAWLSQLHSYEQWVTPDQAQEGLWASQLVEAFLGVTYAGPANIYSFGNPLIREADGALKPDVDAATRCARNAGKIGKDKLAKGVESTAWEPWMFRRLERKRRLFVAEPLEVVTWKDLAAKVEKDSEEDNTDPAIPVTTACQHMTSFTIISRGFRVDWMGNATHGPVGLNASDACWGTPLFCKERVEIPEASVAGAAAGGEAGKVPEKPKKPYQTSYVNKVSGESIEPLDGKHVAPSDLALDVKKAREVGLGPGSIVVYDPDRGADTSAILWMNEYEQAIYGDAVRVWGLYLKTRQTNRSKGVTFESPWVQKERASECDATLARIDKQILDNKKKTEKRTKADESKLAALEAEHKKHSDLKPLDKRPRTAIAFPGGRQYDGSHIFAILRVHPDKPYVQYIDVNQRENLAELTATGSEGLILRQGGAGIVDGCAKHERIYDEKNAFAGYGILPPHTIDAGHVAHLKKARPVGLARFALTVRPVGKGGKARMMTSDDVLYVSALFRMYGDGETENHYISHLLWSLRNTPGFTTVQPWFFVYAPRGHLARAMYSHGARKMKIGDFLAQHRPGGDGLLEPDDLIMQVVVSNEGDEARAGQCSLYCRYKSAPNGAATVTSFQPVPPPGPLMALVDPSKLRLFDKKKRSLNWNQSHVHPKVQLDPAALPALFREGG